MRYAPGHKEETRKRILQAAGQTFRLHGYDGIGVDGLAAEAGITSGAFYSHYRNKQAAFEAAVVEGMEQLRAGIEMYRAHYGRQWVGVFTAWYFSRERRQELASGCALPSLSPEVTRADGAVRAAYQGKLLEVIEAIAAGLAGGTEEERRERARVMLALLGGGVMLARAVENEDIAAQMAGAVCKATVAAAGLTEDSEREMEVPEEK